PEGQDTVDVPATITVTDGSGKPVTKDITITVQRDTDGDGIPDETDKEPKTPNTDSAVTPATVVEGQPVENTKVVTPESPNSV
ncbi:hypothetical protein ACTGW9_11770, partial [Streptococcus suis]